MKEEKLKQIHTQIFSFIQELKDQSIENFFSQFQSGKMLRSKLMLSICFDHPDIVKLCAIVEMIQNASLLHDDVIDDSLLRRGEPSINALFGNKNAIMLGDVLYSKAFYELLFFDREIAKTLSDCVVRLSRGEINDVVMAQAFCPDKARYFAMIEDKTASLIASSAKSAAILAGLDAKQYYTYGLNLGIAFQIVDDLLDVFGNERQLGKPAMNDFAEGKTTLPYILLYAKLSKGDQEILQSFFKSQDSEAKEWILNKMQEFEIFKDTQKVALDCGMQALEAIKGDEGLEKIVREMIFREF
ncbi:polyprenyl synthetase family protein [Helicobacter anatolicus]|uniref:polyprenyl synthetase family protein n=1 Tax=Helicobacter anatolicus TaxID=2905874 RepID=UPI001E5C8F20|nr:polyprenyl synthetase family protein [Helicobacter anatolicus]MCE3038896.1 polyprenyl synthetase family protein [Helicobacter anatolicus]